MDPKDVSNKSYVDKAEERTKEYVNNGFNSVRRDTGKSIKKVKDEIEAKLVKDSVNKESIKYLEYTFILNVMKPKFWFSSFHPEVFASRVANVGVKEVTKILYAKNLNYKFNSSNYVISEYEFGLEYTFIGVVKRLTPGRVFTSLVGNKFFGFWKNFMNVVWHDTPIHMNGVSSTEDIQIIIYVSSLNKKKLYNNNTLIFEKDTVTNAWGNLVIGDTMLQEGAEFELYDCIGFDRILTDKEINKIRSIIKI
jgi:hypothetical protein